MTMTKRDDTSMAEQNAEIRRWAEENGLTLGSRLGQQEDMVERLTPRVPVVEVTVRIDEDVYEAAMLRATYDGYDNASEVVDAAYNSCSFHIKNTSKIIIIPGRRVAGERKDPVRIDSHSFCRCRRNIPFFRRL